jgi:hypothetical protein
VRQQALPLSRVSMWYFVAVLCGDLQPISALLLADIPAGPHQGIGCLPTHLIQKLEKLENRKGRHHLGENVDKSNR